MEEHRESADLILTTIDHAKSQAFDTVFLLRADHLASKNRLYVAISRAKQRLFLLVDGQVSEEQKRKSLLYSIPYYLCNGSSEYYGGVGSKETRDDDRIF